ncbi:MAG: PIN domain-containing protein [Reichenbachiella sp.]|uniref:PIN domain-containing protein n=1 Tax=Reichenbachiella sp. TaxID=2184521 RepID=UPI0029676731|nr:PIN domain-containing protein [Reichenbachiella sp.]MDW3209005.1 PIN domain-containing protein [Reichenbachiella sp.]
MMILVDSSVWIEFFKKGNDKLEQLIQENLACTNELILTELLPIFQKQNNQDIIEGMLALPTIPLNIDWEIIRKYQLLNLQNGINKVGIPDIIILQQVLENKLELFTLDKHFLLMQGIYDIQLFR